MRSQICTKQLIGIAGIAAERIHRALGLPGGIEGALRVLELHPMLNPAAYVTADVRPGLRACAPFARARGRRLGLAGGARRRSPLQAIVAAVDPHLDVEVTGTDTDWTARVIETDTAAKELP